MNSILQYQLPFSCIGANLRYISNSEKDKDTEAQKKYVKRQSDKHGSWDGNLEHQTSTIKRESLNKHTLKEDFSKTVKFMTYAKMTAHDSPSLDLPIFQYLLKVF